MREPLLRSESSSSKYSPIKEPIEIFDSVCMKSLSGHCTESDFCQFVHDLPAEAEVRENLKRASETVVEKAFDTLLLPVEKLRYKYYAEFADYFGQRKKRRQLQKMMTMCKRPEYNLLNELKSVVEGFVGSGLDYCDAIDMMLIRIRDDLKLEDFYHVLNAIVDERNKKAGEHCLEFVDVFQFDHYSFSVDIFDRVLRLTLDQPDLGLVAFVCEVLYTCTTTTMQRIKRELLDEFIALFDKYKKHLRIDKTKTNLARIDSKPPDYSINYK